MVRLVPGAAIIAISLCSAAIADAPADEVEHLLGFVESSGCIFDRNGSRHSAAEAREHIERKYNYLREKLSTSEEFIQYAASESSFTGKAYHVECDGRRQPSRQWLLDELEQYRESVAQG